MASDQVLVLKGSWSAMMVQPYWKIRKAGSMQKFEYQGQTIYGS